MPESPLPAAFSAVYADDPLARGLARHGGLEPRCQASGLTDLGDAAAGSSVLAVVDRLREPTLDGDLAGWAGAVSGLERAWFGLFPETVALLEGQGVRLMRRPLALQPQALACAACDGGIELRFELPRGAFATVLLREFGEFRDSGGAAALGGDEHARPD